MAKKRKWNTDRMLGISAMTISFFTLLIFMYQTNLMRKQNYVSILPYLSISTSNNSVANNYRLSLENQGVGPAIVESVHIQYMDKTYDMADYNHEVFTFLKTKVYQLDSIQSVSYSTLDPGLAIPANSNYTIVEIKNSAVDYEVFTMSLQKLLEEGLSFEVIYKSIQNERWRITNDTQGPERLD